MFLFIERLAEEAIQKHLREGGFDNLKGEGRPVDRELPELYYGRVVERLGRGEDA